MRIKAYRDESYSTHVDLIGGGTDGWTVDLVSVAASLLLGTGFVCALLARF
jgi:hypothetical protein